MRRAGSAFAPLRVRNYRLFFTGQLVSTSGTWMQRIAQAWLVLELTGSGVWLGVVAALQALPTLVVGPWGGTLADRADKRRLLVATQLTSALPAAVLGVLVLTGAVRLWAVMVLALVLGLADAVDKPARNSFAIEMVGPELLTSAVTLNSVVMNSGKVVGPAIAGGMIAWVGLAPSFLLNAASFVALIAGLLLMDPAAFHRSPPARRVPGQVREGLRYVARTPELLATILLMTVAGLLAYEWAVTLPLLATDVFGVGSQGLGLMFSAVGAGAVVGGLLVAGSLTATVARLAAAALAFAACVLGTAVATDLRLLHVVLFGVGASSITLRALATSYAQLRSDPQLRGRVAALLLVAITGTTPVGAPLAGWIGESFGARTALVVAAVSTAVAAVGAYAYVRSRAGAEGVRRAPVPAAPAPALDQPSLSQ